MLTVIAVTLLAAPPSLAVPSFSSVGVPADKVAFLAEHLAEALSRNGLRVLTEKDVATVLGMERQRQLLNCDAQSTCLSELAGALGVEALLVGNVARLDELFVVDLKVISARDGRRLASHSLRAGTDLQLIDQLGLAARALAVQLGATAAEVKEVSVGGPPRWVGFLVAGAGVALGVTAVVFGEQATAAKRGLDPAETISLAEGARLREQGKDAQTASVALAIAGGALVVGGAVMAWAPWKNAVVAVAPSSTGAQLVISGAFP